jgi:hypothetical protein
MLTTVYLDESEGHVPLEDKFRKFNFEIKSANRQLNVSLRGEDKVLGELNITYSASREDKHMTPLGHMLVLIKMSRHTLITIIRGSLIEVLREIESLIISTMSTIKCPG